MKKEKEPKGIVFDCDGTLADSLPITYKGMRAVFTRCRKTPPTFGEYIAHCHPPFEPFYRERGIKESLLSREEIWSIFNAALPSYRDVPLFPDVSVCLGALQRRNVPMGIVSSNTESRIRLCLRTNEPSLRFDNTIVGGVFDKTEALKEMREKLNVEVMWFVGDAPTDMHDAKNAGDGIVPIGLARDKSRTQSLFEAGTSMCFADLSSLIEYFLKGSERFESVNAITA